MQGVSQAKWVKLTQFEMVHSVYLNMNLNRFPPNIVWKGFQEIEEQLTNQTNSIPLTSISS